MPARRISPSSAQSSGLTLLIATEILIQSRLVGTPSQLPHWSNQDQRTGPLLH